MPTARTLRPDELHRVTTIPGPLQGADPARLQQMTIAVVEVDGAIAAYWVVWYALHVEPLWIGEAYRHQPKIAAALIGELEQVVTATDESAAFCVIEAENLATVGAMATKLDFREAPGKLFYLMVPADTPVEG